MSATRSLSAAVLGILVLAAAPAAETAASKTIGVRNDKQFRAAVAKLRSSGGTIKLLPHHYRTLVVPPRSGRPLRIVGRPGVRIERILFDRTKCVSLSRFRISPRAEHAIVEVNHSKDIDLDRLTVSAWGTRLSAS